MSNRAVITTDTNFFNNGLGLYLHWNGGRDSVDAFLKYAKLRGIPNVMADPSYFWARLSQIISNYVGGTNSVGLNVVGMLDEDNFDNGVYIIDENFEIVDRRYFEGEEQQEYPLDKMLEDIDMAQPEGERLADVLKDWNGDYSELIEVKDENINIPLGRYVITRDGEYCSFDVRKSVGDGEYTDFVRKFKSLTEANFFKNFVENGYGWYVENVDKFDYIYNLLTDENKSIFVEKDFENLSSDTYCRAEILSSNKGGIIVNTEKEIDNMCFQSPKQFDEFKDFILNKDYNKQTVNPENVIYRQEGKTKTR